MLSVSEIIEILDKQEAGFRHPTDPFFQAVNEILPKYVKQGCLVADHDSEDETNERNEIFCNVPGCKRNFSSVATYQSHYNSLHRFICCECRKNLPTSHLLDLHVSEKHDAFFLVQSQRQPMYQCLIEECKHKSKSPEERKDHCIRVHKFPFNYRFDINFQSSRKTSNVDNLSMMAAADEQPKPLEKNEFTFGHQKSKTFTHKSKEQSSRKVRNSNVFEDSQIFMDLLESLPSEK